jgi:hypothetical protein
MGSRLVACRVEPFSVARPGAAAVVVRAEAERLRLHNLSPQKGSRRDEKRKGRGYGGHQVRWDGDRCARDQAERVQPAVPAWLCSNMDRLGGGGWMGKQQVESAVFVVGAQQ